MANGRKSPSKGSRLAAIENSLDLLEDAHWSVNSPSTVEN